MIQVLSSMPAVRHHEVDFCAIEGCLPLAQIRGRLLCALLCARSLLDQVLGAHILLPVEGQRGLRLRHPLLRLLDSRLLRIDLSVELGDGGLRLVDLRLHLIDSDAVIAIIAARACTIGAALERAQGNSDKLGGICGRFVQRYTWQESTTYDHTGGAWNL